MATATNTNRIKQVKDRSRRVGSWLNQSLVSQRQNRMSVEGLSIGAASANIGRQHMELPDIWEEKEEVTPTPRSTLECHFYRILWCGTLHYLYLSIQVTRPFLTSLLMYPLSC
jgi:hypothetical protein